MKYSGKEGNLSNCNNTYKNQLNYLKKKKKNSDRIHSSEEIHFYENYLNNKDNTNTNTEKKMK